MVVLVTNKNEEDPSKMNALECIHDYMSNLKHSRAANSEVSG